jgi:site-specific recombinase XerD
LWCYAYSSVVDFVDNKSTQFPKLLHPHKFRATFLTRLLQSGCDIANVQALAGHKSIKTTQRYLGTSTQLRREAVNRLKLPEAPAEQ